ncbi:LOW QUALITY PROTEIN: hypothetical protein MAR_011364 [Mya arenaria]|uniref:Secreted protein n=1 Tax=Mya arenaria TaxID=6604 RepID=A0ABY7FTW2_MYAAR|nr:LOW QUALITY PROTEIN: hypothetical protein MAR_011364 [Mya arenaria]
MNRYHIGIAMMLVIETRTGMEREKCQRTNYICEFSMDVNYKRSMINKTSLFTYMTEISLYTMLMYWTRKQQPFHRLCICIRVPHSIPYH